MKHYCWWIKTLVVICILFGCQLASSMAAVTIDVEMRLNDGGFVSYDHFQADLYLNNLGRMVSDASIFGILEVMGEFFFWPSFSSEVDFELMDIKPGETVVTILAFDFGDIEDFIPLGRWFSGEPGFWIWKRGTTILRSFGWVQSINGRRPLRLHRHLRLHPQ